MLRVPRGHVHSRMTAIPIRFRRTERGLFVQKLQHAIPSIVVLGDGLNHLSHNPHGAELALVIAPRW